MAQGSQYEAVQDESPGSGFQDISGVVEIVAELESAYGGAADKNNFVGDEAVLLNGTFDVSSYDELNYYVGGQGSSTSGGFNGGGDPGSNSEAYGGGGGTDIRLGGNAVSDRIFVAGAAGGQGTDSEGNIYFGGGPGFFNEASDGEGQDSSSGGPGGQSPNSFSDPNFDEFEGSTSSFSYGGGGGGGYHAGGAGSLGGGGGGASYYDETLAKNTPSTSGLSKQTLDGAVTIDFRDAADPDFTVTPSSPVAGESVEFDETIDYGYYGSDTVSWDLSVRTASGDTVTATYDEAGDYDVTLTVTDSEGYSSSITKTVTVEKGANVDFDVPADITQGFDVTFTDQTTYASGESADSESWIVDGAFIDSTTDLTYSFDSPGEKVVKKQVTVNGIQYSKSVVVDVGDAATVDFSYDTPVVSEIEQTFTDQTTTVSGATREGEQWIIDGTSVSTSTDLNYTFDQSGDYNVGKIVTVNGYDYSKGETVTVQQNTTAEFSYSPSEPLEGEQISFNDQSVTPFTITSYSWSFGDGTTSTNQNPTHTYSSIGEYEVTLTVEDDQNQTDSKTEIVNVFSEKPTVETDAATNVGDFEATFNGTILDPGVDSTADVYFEYRETGASTWNSTAAQTISEEGTYSETVTGLSIGTEYEYRAVGENSNGVYTASNVTFSTDDNTAPSVGDITVSPDPIERSTAHDVSFEASDEVGVTEAVVEWEYDSTVQTSQTFTYSSSTNVSETLTDFYTPTSFGTHTIRVSLTDGKGLTSSATITKTLSADEPTINLQAPSDGSKLGYEETFDYVFDVSTENSAVTAGTLTVVDQDLNTVQEETLGTIGVESSKSFSITGAQTENAGTYDWQVELDYETGNTALSVARSLTISSPTEVSVATGDTISGGYGLIPYGEEGYGESIDAIGFNYFNAEGGVIFEGDSSQLDLYFQYRKEGESAWKETAREVYDTGGS